MNVASSRRRHCAWSSCSKLYTPSRPGVSYCSVGAHPNVEPRYCNDGQPEQPTLAVVRTTRVKIRRHRTARSTFLVTEEYSGGSIARTTYEASSLREAITRVLDSKEPGYELDIKVRI